MKTSISLLYSDILPHKKRFIHKIIKNKIFNGLTPEEVFNCLKKSGLDGFELILPQFSVPTDSDISEIKQLSKKYSFPVLSVHQSIRLLTTTKLSEIKRLFEVADMLSAKVVVLHINSAKRQIFDQTYISALHKLEKQYKIRVAFENMEKHVGSYFYTHRWHEKKFADLVKKTDFYITLDTVHLAHSGGDIITFFKENKERILNVHLSDYRYHFLNSSLLPMKFKHMPLGDGELPIISFMSLLRQEGYNGLLTLELHADINGVERSAAVIKTRSYD